MNTIEFLGMYQGILDRMTTAGWIDRYAFQEGAGIAVEWTDEGSDLSIGLKLISETYNLTSGPHHARVFDRAAEANG